MGLATVGQETFDGEIESDAESTPNAGRTAVQYCGDDDSLFGDSPAAGGFQALDALTGLDGDPTALITQLEAMAAEFEKLSGEPETQIRSQIALLRSVIDSRPAAVAQSRAHMDAALQIVGVEADGQADDRAAAALHSVSSGSITSIEHSMASVSASLREDPEAAAMVARVLSASK